MGSVIKRRWDEKRRWIFFVGTMKKLCLQLCIWFWWRWVIVRVLKTTKMTLKTVLSEGKSFILHRVIKSARFDPHRAHFIPAIAPASPAFSQRSVLEHCVAFCCFWPLRATIGCYWQQSSKHFCCICLYENLMKLVTTRSLWVQFVYQQKLSQVNH